jgi:hypothetical protein
MASSSGLSAARRAALATLTADLRRIFGVSLRGLVAYGLTRDPDGELHTLAIAERVTFEHLAACASATDGWRRAGLAVPLLLSEHEFRRTLDVFPIEYDAIIRDHLVIDGEDPLADAQVAEADLRRACEEQAKSHLIHLREAFLERSREPAALRRLIASSAPAFRTVLLNIARLGGAPTGPSHAPVAEVAAKTIGLDRSVVQEVLSYRETGSAAADPTALLARYLEAAEQVWRFVDGWRRA